MLITPRDHVSPIRDCLDMIPVALLVVRLYGSNPSFPGYWAYYDNAFGGIDAGPDWTSLRDPGNWIGVIEQPPVLSTRIPGSITSPTPGRSRHRSRISIISLPPMSAYPISSFNSIRAYRNKFNPGGTGVNYDASWDLYGWAHTATRAVLDFPGGHVLDILERNPGPVEYQWSRSRDLPGESGLEFGDGNVWDLYLTFHNWNATTGAYDGGVSHAYSYAILCLSDISGNGPAP